MENLNLKYEHSQPFELVLVTRNADGEPIGKKTCITDSAYKLHQFYLRHRGKPKKKNTEVVEQKNLKVVKQHGNLQSYVDTTERTVIEENDSE